MRENEIYRPIKENVVFSMDTVWQISAEISLFFPAHFSMDVKDILFSGENHKNKLFPHSLLFKWFNLAEIYSKEMQKRVRKMVQIRMVRRASETGTCLS